MMNVSFAVFALIVPVQFENKEPLPGVAVKV
jgi:hypothetical protein